MLKHIKYCLVKTLKTLWFLKVIFIIFILNGVKKMKATMYKSWPLRKD